MEKLNSHFDTLLGRVLTQKKQHSEGIPTSVIKSQMSRGNGPGIFEEGESFGGNVHVGEAEICLTVVNSPHVVPSIPVDDFIKQAEEIYKRNVTLPKGLEKAMSVAPHLIVWWRANLNNQIFKKDIFDLFNSNEDSRSNFIKGIKNKYSTQL